MSDSTEQIRRELVEEINSEQAERERLEAQYGDVWDTKEMSQVFDVIGFMAPFCVVVRKADQVKGSILFQHRPRYYFSFTAD